MHIHLSSGELIEHLCNHLEKGILWRQLTTPVGIVLLHRSLSQGQQGKQNRQLHSCLPGSDLSMLATFIREMQGRYGTVAPTKNKLDLFLHPIQQVLLAQLRLTITVTLLQEQFPLGI